ncbi:MAG: hypothetical protein EOP50_00415 [Sphingobacteriales bacterium]|nr:MAG: hypothetical protein EOP50_00415 [Sphingobacteriales bacterium]
MVTRKPTAKSVAAVQQFASNVPGEYRTIDIKRLHLNPENPRHSPLERQPEIIRALYSSEEVQALARDIASRGALSPLDMLGVYEMPDHPGHYITLEGNRRTCSLILLADPARAPTPDARAYLKSLVSGRSVPTQVPAFVFPTKEAADQWIDLRHMGAQGGVGTRSWSADQQANALARRNGGGPATAAARQNLLAHAVLMRLKDAGLISTEQHQAVSLTTIARYLTTPAVRVLLGLAHHERLEYTHDPAEVDGALQRLVIDSLEKRPGEDQLRVTSRSNADGRRAYAQGLAAEGVAPTTLLSSPIAPPTINRPATKSARPTSARNPNLETRLLTTAFAVNHSDKVLGYLRQEMLKLKVVEHPFACNYLLRAFVERVMTLFLVKRGVHRDKMNDRELTQTCAREMQAAGAKRGAYDTVNRAGSNDSTPYNLACLGAAIHGGHVPTQRDLVKYSHTWQPALRFMLDHMTEIS